MAKRFSAWFSAGLLVFGLFVALIAATGAAIADDRPASDSAGTSDTSPSRTGLSARLHNAISKLPHPAKADLSAPNGRSAVADAAGQTETTATTETRSARHIRRNQRAAADTDTADAQAGTESGGESLRGAAAKAVDVVGKPRSAATASTASTAPNPETS
jgi:hypothetical protein